MVKRRGILVALSCWHIVWAVVPPPLNVKDLIVTTDVITANKNAYSV